MRSNVDLNFSITDLSLELSSLAEDVMIFVFELEVVYCCCVAGVMYVAFGTPANVTYQG